MSMQAMLMPVFAKVALTFVLLVCMQFSRMRAIRRGQVPAHSIALREPNWPPRVTQIGNAYHNQLETPLLFYVLILLAIVTQTADSILFVLSWLFVVSRFVHAYIHLTSNRIDRRHWACADVDHRRRPPHHRHSLMTPGARASAAIDVLADIADRKRPAAVAPKEWGLAHRFAGSG